MSFSGKRYRRVSCENIDQLVRTSSLDPRFSHVLNSPAPTFCFTKIGEDVFRFHCQMNMPGVKDIKYTFKLNEELEMIRIDGTKIQMVFSLERDNILNQVVRMPEGKMGHFRREFWDNQAVMILRIDGAEVEGKIYYELVQ